MKRLALFTWSQYYPRGGFNDLEGIYDSEEKLNEAIENNSSDWYEVIDLDTGKRIESGALTKDYTP